MSRKRGLDDQLDTENKRQKPLGSTNCTYGPYSTLQNLVPDDWSEQLQDEFDKPYWSTLCAKVQAKAAEGTVYPAAENVFQALELTPFKDVRVVVLGQDPYHGPGQAHGLSFSVLPGVKIPPSLRNIYKELSQSFKCPMPTDGYLVDWSKQGVLMLNTVLTVTRSKANSHKSFGWQIFTDAVIKKINDELEGVVFLLWGNNAKAKRAAIDETKHHVLESVHPSPFSARLGFFGNGHFKETNRLLEEQGQTPITWIKKDETTPPVSTPGASE